MTLEFPVTRVIVPTLTFFDAQGHVDALANRLLIRHILQNTPHCLFLMGSTGEGLYFQDKPQEKQRYIEIVKETLAPMKAARELPIVIGIYGETIDQAVKDASACLQAYSSAGLVLPPPTKRKLEETDQLNFFSGVLEQVSAPLYLYNNPGAFGGTNITPGVVKELTRYSNFKGIKDSSGTLAQKEAYLQVLTKNITVSCGKEGMLAEFLKTVPVPSRGMVGIVPSISNLVNTSARIVELGLGGKDQDMLAMQAYMNEFREKIYDSASEKGKAQRGVKLAFSHIYRNLDIKIPQTVRPEFRREMTPDIIMQIKQQADILVKAGHILLAEP